MLRKLTHRLPIDLFEELQEEASKHRITMSDLIRGKLLFLKNSNLSFQSPLSPGITQNNSPPPSPPQTTVNQSQETDPAILEILFLLREFLFERNGQILKKVDEKMERRFGKDRKKNL